MSRAKSAASALCLARSSRTQPQFVCRACRQHASRQFHASSAAAAEAKTFWERLKERTFGAKKQEEKLLELEKKAEEKAADIAEAGGAAQAEEVTIEGKVYQIAPFVSRTLDPDYVKATDWAGLEVVGGEKWAKKQHDKGEQYVGFSNVPSRQFSAEEMSRLVFMTMVEALALRQSVLPLSLLSRRRTSQGSQAVLERKNVSISEGEIKFADQAAIKTILRSMPTKIRKWRPGPRPVEIPKLTWVIPTGLEQVKLTNPELILAVTKRVHQLTGKRAPDMALSPGTTLRQLMDAYAVKPTPKRLIKHDSVRKTLERRRNVRRAPTKTFRKEQEVGRWKLIVDELNKRDLPVRGTRHAAGKKYIPGLQTLPPMRINPPPAAIEA